MWDDMSGSLWNITIAKDPGAGGNVSMGGGQRPLPVNGLPPNTVTARARGSTASSMFENCYAEIPSDSFRIHGGNPDMKSIEYMEKSLGSPTTLPGRYHPSIVANGSPVHNYSPDSGVGLNTSRGSCRARPVDDFDMYEMKRLKRQQRKYVVLHVIVMALAGIAYIGIGIVSGYYIGQSHCSDCDMLQPNWSPTIPPPHNATEEGTTEESADMTTPLGWFTTDSTTTSTTAETTTLSQTPLPASPYNCSQEGDLCVCGPFGGDSGEFATDQDAYNLSREITGFTIRHTAYLIYGIQFSYDGQPGANLGWTQSSSSTIQLIPPEYITQVDLDFTLGKQFLTRIEIHTTKQTHGPYGAESGQRFRTAGNKLLYISGQSGLMVDQLTLYYDRCR